MFSHTIYIKDSARFNSSFPKFLFDINNVPMKFPFIVLFQILNTCYGQGVLPYAKLRSYNIALNGILETANVCQLERDTLFTDRYMFPLSILLLICLVL